MGTTRSAALVVAAPFADARERDRLLIGIPAALAVTQSMSEMLSGVVRTDPVTYGAVVAMLGIVAFLASYLPARRATRVDPLVVLRTD